MSLVLFFVYSDVLGRKFLLLSENWHLDEGWFVYLAWVLHDYCHTLAWSMNMISWKFPFLVKQVKCWPSYNGHITLQRKRWYTNNTLHPVTRGRVLCKTYSGYITTRLSITCCKTKTIHNKRQSNDQSKLRKVHSASAMGGKIHSRYQAREGACGAKSWLVLPYFWLVEEVARDFLANHMGQ